jgi:hypothetical protein
MEMERDRFFIDTESGGKWVLVRQGSKRPMRSIETKTEGEIRPRDGAKARKNGQLVVKDSRHRDGMDVRS